MAYVEILLGLIGIAAPDGGPALHEPYEEPRSDSPARSIDSGAPNVGQVTEPSMRAINGYVLVSFLNGLPRRYYVGHGPDFIADQIRNAVSSGQSTYSYWDKPGWPDAKQITIPTSRHLVTDIRVQHLEADIDAIFEGHDCWALA